MKNITFFLILSLILITNKLSAQEIIKLNANLSNVNESVKKRVTDLLSITDITYLKSNGEIKYGSQNSITIYTDYDDINSLSSTSQGFRNTVKNALVKVKPNNTNGNINLDSLNVLPELDFIYLLIEGNLIDNQLINMINATNPNWIITYQLSLPQ